MPLWSLAALNLLLAAPTPTPAQPDMAQPAVIAPAELGEPGEPGVPGEPTEAEIAAAIAEFDASLNYARGEVLLPGGLAALQVPPAFRFLATDDARRVLELAWGNPPDESVLGMLFPSDVSPVDPEAGWGVVITYRADGHIDDADAASIDYDELLATMQGGIAEENKLRAQQGYPAVALRGWAESPHYDAATRKLYWARQLNFGDSIDTLNYAIRVLGREGVLELNAVAPMARLPAVKPAMEQILGFVDFTPGNRYSDFDPDKDKTAAYGIGGLIAGGLLASKTGLLKGLWIALIAGKKFVLIALVAIGVGLKKFFTRNRDT